MGRIQASARLASATTSAGREWSATRYGPDIASSHASGGSRPPLLSERSLVTLAGSVAAGAFFRRPGENRAQSPRFPAAPGARGLEDDLAGRAHLRDFGIRRAPRELQYKTSWVIDLTPTEDELLREMKPTHRRNINKGRRNGIVVVEDNAPATRERFYILLRETAARDGFPIRTHDYLMAAWDTCLPRAKPTSSWPN